MTFVSWRLVLLLLVYKVWKVLSLFDDVVFFVTNGDQANAYSSGWLSIALLVVKEPKKMTDCWTVSQLMGEVEGLSTSSRWLYLHKLCTLPCSFLMIATRIPTK